MSKTIKWKNIHYADISIMKPSHKKTNPGVGMSSETLDWIGLIMTSPVQVIYHL